MRRLHIASLVSYEYKVQLFSAEPVAEIVAVNGEDRKLPVLRVALESSSAGFRIRETLALAAARFSDPD